MNETAVRPFHLTVPQADLDDLRRDVTFDDDRSQVRTSNRSQMMAALRIL